MFFRKALASTPVNLDVGIFLIRLGIGLSMIAFHGYGKIAGGADTWYALGTKMGYLGIGFLPTFWGFMAGFSEFFCSILLILGIFFRPAALLLAFTMFVAILNHLNLPVDHQKAGWSGASHAIELLVIYVGLFLTGPGRYAFRLIHKRDLKRE
jgi:putative oxidoreductase